MSHSDHGTQPVLIALDDGDFAWFLTRVTQVLSGTEARRLYPRGVQIAEARMAKGCIYCSHARYDAARRPAYRTPDEAERAEGKLTEEELVRMGLLAATPAREEPTPCPIT